MRWFKHFTGMLDDAFVIKLIDEFGIEGYGIWCGILELYARYCEDKCGEFIHLPFSILNTRLRVKAKKIENILSFCSTHNKLEWNGKPYSLEVKIPKMLELRDEWTSRKNKNSGAARETLGLKKKEEKNNLPNGRAPESAPTHPIWGDGVQLLVAAGMKEQAAKSYLGRAIKQYGEGAVNDAISATLLKDPADPKSYLAGCLKKAKEEDGVDTRSLDWLKQYAF